MQNLLENQDIKNDQKTKLVHARRRGCEYTICGVKARTYLGPLVDKRLLTCPNCSMKIEGYFIGGKP